MFLFNFILLYSFIATILHSIDDSKQYNLIKRMKERLYNDNNQRQTWFNKYHMKKVEVSLSKTKTNLNKDELGYINVV